MVLLKWIDTLHSHSVYGSTILQYVPFFVERFLAFIDQKVNFNSIKSDVSRKCFELLDQFLKEFADAQNTSLFLDKEIIEKILNFLLQRKYHQDASTSSLKGAVSIK